MRASEFSNSKLVIFDIDDTLVNTDTRVNVVKDGKIIKQLNSHDFTHYKLQPGEEFDFGAFKDAREFFTQARPIPGMIRQLKHDINTGNKVIMLTARSDFNDRDIFLDTFRRFGIDMDRVHVYRAGNLAIKAATEEKKKIILQHLLGKTHYDKVIMYDDSVPNLNAFLSLKQDYPWSKFYAWHVDPSGRADEYHRTDIKENKNTATAQQVLDYINDTHHESFRPGEDMYAAVVAHPHWRLQRVPLLNLNIPDQEYDDVDYDEYEPEADPYNRVMTVDPTHAGEISQHLVDRYPIVIDSDRYIIDGNHRAWAAKYLLNRDYIMAWRPVKNNSIDEAFDQPYKGKWEHGDESHDLLVKLPDGSNLSIMFSLDYGAYGDEEWTVEFWRDNSQDVTGAGDQQRIFATVLSAIKKFIDKKHPERIRFSANKDVETGQKSLSRTNLYNRLVQRYANSWGYDVDIDDFADTTVYNLYSLYEDIAENFADGRVKGKSRPGRVKRSGASCAGSVTDLRARAKKYGGERGKMYHWCANMKSGRKKNK